MKPPNKLSRPMPFSRRRTRRRAILIHPVALQVIRESEPQVAHGRGARRLLLLLLPVGTRAPDALHVVLDGLILIRMDRRASG
jgi:hypothetical protein